MEDGVIGRGGVGGKKDPYRYYRILDKKGEE
jgi:hypothetical protein